MKIVDPGQMGQGPQSSSSEDVFAGGQEYQMTVLAAGSLSVLTLAWKLDVRR